MVETTVPITYSNTQAQIFSCSGHSLSDFRKGGLPLEYDVAHHAIALDVYGRADEFGFPLTDDEKELARRVKEVGITQVILEELDTLPEIYFTHSSNASKFMPKLKQI